MRRGRTATAGTSERVALPMNTSLTMEPPRNAKATTSGVSSTWRRAIVSPNTHAFPASRDTATRTGLRAAMAALSSDVVTVRSTSVGP